MEDPRGSPRGHIYSISMELPMDVFMGTLFVHRSIMKVPIEVPMEAPRTSHEDAIEIPWSFPWKSRWKYCWAFMDSEDSMEIPMQSLCSMEASWKPQQNSHSEEPWNSLRKQCTSMGGPHRKSTLKTPWNSPRTHHANTHGYIP